MADLVYYVAASLDGFIAHPDGSFDGFEWDDEVVADFFAELEGFGTVLMGRKTYDVGLAAGTTSPYPAMRQVVFSRTMAASPDDAVELARGDLAAFVRDLKAQADAPVWLCGGGDVAGTLARAGLIDRLVVKLNPVVFGAGIPLVAPGAGLTSLTLTETQVYDCGIVVLRYEVGRPRKAT
ncbi:dihydrofolate reductase family protein [Rubrivirga sp. IMCC43871]|uniref:dihydrofolate reductase family protein n=1 Tax=Rubrivirga sp. IMCC43871 TaxID=3391575 RepID=UPI0039903004